MGYIPTFSKGNKFNDDYYPFIKALGIELEKENLIHNFDQSSWMYIFSSLDTFKGSEVFTWTGKKNHCVYLIDELVREGIIKGENIDSKIERFFAIKNPAQTRYSYYPNKPKDSEQIDSIILRVLKSL
jgi:hypothetical protein